MSRVFVGVSGGVDSAIAAYLLQKAGHKVTAVFMKNWSGVTAGVVCPWEDDYQSALRVAAHLQIPLKLYDFEQVYRETVGRYLIETYQAGLTPNPDIMCNEEIKFGAFLNKCIEDGAEKIATGHYARIVDGRLLRGLDSTKDQSYFLYRIGEAALSQSLFPIGTMHKKAVRALAQKIKLPNATRADSQGICFVGPVSMKQFLHEFIDYKKGEVINDAGQVVGEHDGVFFYTIGQRHGLGIGGGKPYYIYGKDVAKNIVYVTTDEQSRRLNRKSFTMHNTIWYEKPKGKKYQVQVRYRSRAVDCQIETANSKAKVILSAPERAIAAGQSAVVYENDKVMGGGIISQD